MMKSYRKWVLICLPVSSVLAALLRLLSLSFLHSLYIDTTLSGKEYLLEKRPRLIFAGDSRAAFQMNPALAARMLDWPADAVVNIGGGHGDIVAIDNLARKHPEAFKNAILIISVSSFQLNDGARDPHYYPSPMMAKMSVVQQIATFFPKYLDTLVDYYQNCIAGLLGMLPSSRLFPETNGFTAPTHQIDVSKMHLEASTHPWYKEFDANGQKSGCFKEALASLKSHTRAVFVFTGAFAPVYLEKLQGGLITQYEESFGSKVTEICQHLEIPFLNFLKEDRIPVEYYADEMHLNDRGADLFTAIVLNDFGLALSNRESLLHRGSR